MNRFWNLQSFGKIKLRLQQDSPHTYQNIGLKFNKLIVPSASKSAKQLELSLVGKEKKNGLSVLYRVKITLSINSSISTPMYLFTQEKCKYMLHKDLCVNVYSTFICNCPKLKIILMPSINEWINKLWNNLVVEYYSAIKGIVDICNSIDWFKKYYAK